jgi:hypothetical protein
VIDVTSMPVTPRTDQTSLVHFYSQHSGMRHCALPEFIRTEFWSPPRIDTVNQSQHQHQQLLPRVCYSEGADSDSRQMCTVVYQVCRCSEINSPRINTLISSDTCSSGVGDECKANGTVSTLLEDGLQSLFYCPSIVSQIDHQQDDCVSVLAESNGYSL